MVVVAHLVHVPLMGLALSSVKEPNEMRLHADLLLEELSKR